jgi:hypothetical protein
MKNPNKDKPKLKTVKFKVDRYQGAAAIMSGLKIPGYCFLSMKRKGENVTAIFEAEK